MASIAEINVRIGARIEGMVKNLKKAERALMRSGRKMQNLGNSLTSSLTLPLAGIGIAGAKMAGDLSDNFSKVENLVGITGDALTDLEQGVKRTSNLVGKSQGELSAAIFSITSAGQRGAEALNTLEAAGKGAVIGLGDTKTVALATTAIMKAYEDENYTAAESVNLLAKTVKAGNLEASELAPTIGKLLPLAKELKIPFKELGANIATYTKLGVPATEATTALKAVLSNIIKPGKQAAKSLASVGLNADELKASIAKNGLAATLDILVKKYEGNSEGLARLFGSVEALTNVLGTAKGQAKTYASVLEEMNKSTDIVEEGFQRASKKGPEVFRKALVRLQNVMIDIGNEVIPLFTDIAGAVAKAAKGFSGLDKSTQKTIVTTGAFIAILGPAIKVIGTIQTTLAGMKAAQIASANAFKFLAGKILVATKATKAFAIANKATTIGVVVAALAFAISAYQHYNTELTTAQKAQKELISINTEAQKSIVDEKRKVNDLVGVLKDNNAKLEDKKKALNELQKISPKYFAGFNAEYIGLQKLTTQQELYNDSIRRTAKIKAGEERLKEYEKQLLDNGLALDEVRGKIGKTITVFGRYEAGLNQGAINRKKSLLLENVVLEEKIKLVQSLTNIERQHKANLEGGTKFDTLFTPDAGGGTDTGDGTETPTLTGAENIDNIKTAVDGLSESMTGLRAITFSWLDNGAWDTAMREKAELLGQMRDKVGETSISAEGMNDWMTRIPESLNMLTEATGPAMERLTAMESTLLNIWSNGQLVSDVFTAAAKSINKATASGIKSLKSLGKTALSSAAEVVKAKMQEAVAAMIASAFKKNPVLGAIVAVTAGTIVSALFAKAMGKIRVPALAEGGLAYSPTLAVVGDNRGAASDPEVIAPLSKLRGMLGGAQRGPIPVTGNFIVRGPDLIAAIRNAEENENRFG